jgi:hypothetical protein
VVTNTNEGNLFVNETFGETLDVATYANLLYPLLTDEEVQGVVDAYNGTGSTLDQLNLIMGECKSVYLREMPAHHSFS